MPWLSAVLDVVLRVIEFIVKRVARPRKRGGGRKDVAQVAVKEESNTATQSTSTTRTSKIKEIDQQDYVFTRKRTRSRAISNSEAGK